MTSDAELFSSTHEMVDDRQGRSLQSSGASRHALDPRTDPRDQAKRSYLEAVADQLDERLRAGEFDQLVVVAAPQALGILRGAFSVGVKAVIADEVAKDLTKVPNHEMAQHLTEHVRL